MRRDPASSPYRRTISCYQLGGTTHAVFVSVTCMHGGGSHNPRTQLEMRDRGTKGLDWTLPRHLVADLTVQIHGGA